MCAAAHAWMGLGRIVYAVSAAQLSAWRAAWGLAGGAGPGTVDHRRRARPRRRRPGTGARGTRCGRCTSEPLASEPRPDDGVPATARALGLEAHPEGGWFRQTWRAPTEVTLPDGRTRATATLIWFLLPAGASSAWHRVTSDEVWLAHEGTVRLQLGGDAEAAEDGAVHEVGADVEAGQEPEVVVPAGHWQRTLPGDRDALVRCLVSPGFDFADFTLVPGD